MATGATDHTSVRVDVLGPVRMSDPTGPRRLRGRLQRGLLAMLATADPARGVATTGLIEGLWGTRPPRDPRHALQAQVSRLRKALPHPSLVRGEGDGYRITGVDVDATRFVALAEAGVAALDAGDAAAGARQLHAALRVWRGPAFDDLADCTGLAPAAARLETHRLRTLEHRVEADLRLGDSRGLVAELRELVERHPLRERLWRALMVALARDGQQAEALAAYRAARETLAQQAGLEPGSLLRETHEALLRRQPLPGLDRPASSVARAGRQSGALPPPRLRRLAAGPFVGRRRDRDGLARLWAAGRDRLQVVLVAGDAGVGKTRLAAQLATEAARDGAQSRYGRCDPTLAVPLQPIAEILRDDVEAVPADGRDDRLGRHPGELARLLPELAVHGQPLPASRATQRRRLLDAIASWLGAASRQAPLLLVIDDLQWADAATLATLRHLVHGPEPVRGLVYVAHRDTELDPAGPVAACLDDLARAQRRVRRLRLGGLTPPQTAELLAAELPPEAEVDIPAVMPLADQLHALTGGNPFRTIALGRQVGDALVGREGLSHDAPQGTGGVHEIVTALATGAVRAV